MNTYKLPSQLPNNQNLLSEQEKECKNTINNLQLKDVKEEEKFKETVAKIKQQFSLTPVTISPPVIKSNRSESRSEAPNYHNLFGGNRTIQIVQVNFDFSGSPKLFQYSPNEFKYGGGSNNRVFQPDYGSTIRLEIEHPSLDKEAIIQKAKSSMECTNSLIKGNNIQIKNWNERFQITIEEMCNAKRKELIDLYS